MGFPVYQATKNYFIENNWHIIAVDLDKNKLNKLQEEGIELRNTPLEKEKATITFIGIRPQDFHSFSNIIFDSDIVVSLMAGITCETIQKAFPRAKILRIIPNTPCEFGVGITPIYTSKIFGEDPLLVELYNALSGCGILMPVFQEKAIDWATGVSAGGPAYIIGLN